MIKDNLTADIKVRLAVEEKELLKKQADDTGVSMSDIVRSALFCEEKLVFLVEGAEIAASLFQIRTGLEVLRSESVIPASEIDRLESALNDVGTQIFALTERLSDVHTATEEAIDNV